MSHWTDPRLWVFLIVAFVWIRRSRRALQTLHAMPVVAKEYPSWPTNVPLVSVIIPAKNEEKNIGACLEGLLAQDYPNFEIIVANDNSTDRTEEILRSFGERLTYVQVSPTPEGWIGKNFAIFTGLEKAHGEWLLFTDADTRHQPHGLAAALAFAQARDLSFLSLLPECLAESFSEKLIQPAAMGYLGLWFPIEKINDPHHPMAFANGQYLLIRRSAYEKIGTHAAVREEFLEDFALMKLAKKNSVRAQCALGVHVYGTRMYTSLETIWKGWRRIYLHAFRQKPQPLLWRAINLLLFSVLPFGWYAVLAGLVATKQAAGFSLGIATSVLILIWITCWRAYGIVKARRIYALLHPIAAFFLAMVLFDASWMAVTRQKTHWR